ncbi:MAG: ParB/RepB/Spo0J family partition protein [Planctomycetota bacterium]|jgi:ParB family chromosome partitioning protein
MASKSAQNRPRLGRGLSSLIVNTAPKEDGTYASTDPTPVGAQEPATIPIAQISPNPYQPRKQFDAEQLKELTDSIRRQGVLQPILVAPNGAKTPDKPFVLIAGQRRLQAATQAGLDNVPAFVRQASDQQIQEWAIIENIQREDLNPIERAEAFRGVMDRFSLTQAQLGERLGTSRETVANYLRLLDLCDDVRKLLLAGRLSFGHARALAALAGQQARQTRLAKKAIDRNLSVRQLEAMVAADVARTGQPKRRGSADKPAYVRDLEQQLTQQVGTRVTIAPGRSKDKGKLTIEYYSLDDFDRILNKLGVSLDS